MKKIYLILLLLSGTFFVNAQNFDVQVIQDGGDSDKLINLVIMGDGYTAAQQNAFISKAQGISNYLFNQAPFSNYKNYFNVFAIKVISNESGAKHPNNLADCSTANPLVPVANPDNYLGSSFDNYGIHRLIIANNATGVANVLAANVPNYDIATVLANTTYYGGSGGSDYCTITAHASANEILAHEMGHSFGGLADEYYAGDQYFVENPNMTAQTDPLLIKWKNWLNSDEPNIGVYNYCCGGNSNLWRKPTSGSCKMEFLGEGYCAVCREAIIERIHSLVNPILNYSPVELNVDSLVAMLDFNLTQLVKPIPNTLEIKWQLDGDVFENNLEAFQVNQNLLTVGTHTLTASVTDATEHVRTDNHATLHVNTVTWTINRSALGVHTIASENKIDYTISPNPSSNVVNVAVELGQSSNVAIDLATADGKIIHSIPAKKVEGKYTDSLSIENLAGGTYFVILKINGVSYTKTLIKQ